MAKAKESKTNAMRILDREKIPYTFHSYSWDGENVPDGASVARALGQDPARVYKTLVTQGASGQYYVFDLPVEEELNLKKAARAVGEKSVSMILSRQLLPVTGYVHGGCSPIGMKKLFPTIFQEDCLKYETIYVSAGRVGLQVEVPPEKLIALVCGMTAEVTGTDE